MSYAEAKEIVKKEVSSAEGVAFDCDSWTSLAMNAYTTIHAHYIDSDWKLQTRTLSTRYCGGFTGTMSIGLMSKDKMSKQIGPIAFGPLKRCPIKLLSTYLYVPNYWSNSFVPS